MNHRIALCLALLLMAVAGTTLTLAYGQTQSPGSRIAQLDNCLVSLVADVEVAAQETGKLVSVEVQEGQQIEADQLIAKIDDQQAQLARYAAQREYSTAVEKASDDIEIRFAKASFEVADAELKQSLAINARSPGSVPESDILQLRLARKRAELQIDRSQLETRVARMTAEIKEAEVKATDASIARRVIHSPLAGTVIEVLRQPGEWVEAGQPVARVVGLERLYVDGFVSSREFNPSELVDQRAIIAVELARGQRVELRGRGVLVSPLGQGGDRLRVRVEATNQQADGHWVLRPGMNAQLMIAAK
jgi:macrolide-specific efflux system membrane fusion protein